MKLRVGQFDPDLRHIKDRKVRYVETSNEKKQRLLGQPFGTATNKLRKMLLFDYAKRLNEDNCYRCQIRIETLEEFSIEHTVAWQGSINPKETFFDITQIAFSHLSCNVAYGNLGKRIYENKGERYKAAHKRLKSDPLRYAKKLADKRI